MKGQMGEVRPKFFWLHIKKSGGQSARTAFSRIYMETDRNRMPSCFIAVPESEWNDVLNNYRVPLGRWQFRRAEFARRFLWPDDWERMLRVAFSREPVSRCVSMFHYLIDPFAHVSVGARIRRLNRISGTLGPLRLPLNRRSAFSAFLDILELQQEMRSYATSKPISVHFSVHTNPMSNDVLDDEGRLLLSHVFRLECLEKAVRWCHAELGVPYDETPVRRNRARLKGEPYRPTRQQRQRIERLFEKDFEIYENAIML